MKRESGELSYPSKECAAGVGWYAITAYVFFKLRILNSTAIQQSTT